jgi:transposase
MLHFGEMAKMQQLTCDEKTRKFLEQRANSHTEPHRDVFRARIILGCLDGRGVMELARALKTRPNTIIKWRDRFVARQLEGLEDRARPGAPRRLPAALREQILRVLEEPPPPGQAVWDGGAVARRLGVSPPAVWRILRSEGICLQRQRSWCISTDPEFVAKAADIVGLYLAPPTHALVICVDEKPSIQALERATGYVETESGTIVRGVKSTYKRHGTLNRFAALQVATGHVHSATTATKTRADFLAFMDQVVAETPADQELHGILDNYCTHKRNEDWLAKHPRVHFHFTPTSASWLNQIEIWVGILSRKALRGASFSSIADLRNAIKAFIANYSQNPRPFKWRKREVHGSQLKNTIVNLRN